MTWYEPHFSETAKPAAGVAGKDTDDEGKCAAKTWLEVLPSSSGMVLAAILAEIMTEGLTPEQENILGNFISAVGSLISYKASRDELCG